MAEENHSSASDALAKSAHAANQIKGAVKAGKAIAGAAKGAAAGDPYGAIAGFAWENRKTTGKILAAGAGILAIPVLFLLMLPGLIFGDLSSTAATDIMNNDAAILANVEDVQTTVNDCIGQAHEAVLARIHKAIAAQPDDTSSRIEDSFTSGVIMDTNMLISQYCASKDKWTEINIDNLKQTINGHKDEVFTYSVTTSTEKSGDKSVVVYTYTVQYIGGEKFKEIFGLDEQKEQLSQSYAENLTTFLYGSALSAGTAAVSTDVERYAWRSLSGADGVGKAHKFRYRN